MQEIKYTYHTGSTRAIGGKKGFGPHQDGVHALPKGAGAKVPKQFSNSAVEIIMPNETRKNTYSTASSEPNIGPIKENMDPNEDAPPDEFDDTPVTKTTIKSSACEDFNQIEEEKEIGATGRKVRETFVKGVGDAAFGKGMGKKKELEGLKIPKSATCALIMSEDKPPASPPKKPEVALKESKSPDPFETTHPHTESRLMELINSTTSPSSPLHDLKRSGNKSSAALRAYKHFIISLFESASFIRKMLPIQEAELALLKLSIPRPLKVTSNKTLVLDLDETLVHCVEGGQESDIRLTIKLPGGNLVSAGINIRPNLVPFLERVSKTYEVILFTASHRAYADAIMDYIDKGRKLVHHRLYRQHCVLYEDKLYIKDLRILGRDLKNVLIVDNAPYSFASQLDNGYPIIPFYDNKADTELIALSNYLDSIEKVSDIREVNRAKFRLRDVAETNICEYAQYYQHTASDIGASEQSCESLSSLGDETPNMYEKVKRTLGAIQSQLAILYKPHPT